MHPNAHLLSIVSLGSLLAGLGCASTTTSLVPARAETEPAPVAVTEPEAEVAPSEPELTPIYFDTDRALLREEARQSLKRHARTIQQHPEWGTVTIEGHCDERGSEEYNLALGRRRAATVARYLGHMGVPSSRLETRTYGEMRPAVVGHDEAAWSRNRRSELQTEAHESAQR
jgi:peptidoglycan-associated lipoprotein